MRTTSALRLQALFATLLPGVALVTLDCGGTTTGATSTGSDGGEVDGGPRDPRFDSLAEALCLTSDEYLFAFPKNATVAPGVDYIGGYRLVAQLSDAGPPTFVFPPNPTLTVGEACKSAANKVACQDALVKFAASSGPEGLGWGGGNDMTGRLASLPVQVRATKGDTITVLDKGPEQVFPFYLPIDTSSEALTRVSATQQYMSVGCSGKDILREASGSYLVYAKNSGCRNAPDYRSGADYTDEFLLRVTAEGGVTVVTKYHSETPNQGCPVAGRRPEGLVCASIEGFPSHGVASYLARMAHLEAASVVAFERMIRELAAIGAPADLLARAASAREDEVRHAETMSGLACAAGAAVPSVKVATDPTSPRSILEIALENVVEGCVRETFGALLAHRQAAKATSTAIRFAMHRIARDETEHAALSWDLHAWLMSKLEPFEQTAVEAALEAASRDLERDAQVTEPSDVCATLGLPDAHEGHELAQSLARALRTDIAA